MKNSELIQLLDTILDDLCDQWGCRAVIEYLLSFGCTKENLLYLHFNETDINIVLTNPFYNNNKKEGE